MCEIEKNYLDNSSRDTVAQTMCSLSGSNNTAVSKQHNAGHVIGIRRGQGLCDDLPASDGSASAASLCHIRCGMQTCWRMLACLPQHVIRKDFPMLHLIHDRKRTDSVLKIGLCSTLRVGTLGLDNGCCFTVHCAHLTISLCKVLQAASLNFHDH